MTQLCVVPMNEKTIQSILCRFRVTLQSNKNMLAAIVDSVIKLFFSQKKIQDIYHNALQRLYDRPVIIIINTKTN